MLKAARPWWLRMVLREVFAANSSHNSVERVSAAVKAWLKWAKRSRIVHFKKLAATSKERLGCMVCGMTDPRNNAFLEAMNGLLRQAKRTARGFRTIPNFIAMVYLRMIRLQHLLASAFDSMTVRLERRVPL